MHGAVYVDVLYRTHCAALSSGGKELEFQALVLRRRDPAMLERDDLAYLLVNHLSLVVALKVCRQLKREIPITCGETRPGRYVVAVSYLAIRKHFSADIAEG
jgi:hypothetical protein